MKYPLLIAALCLSLSSFGQQYTWVRQTIPQLGVNPDNLQDVFVVNDSTAFAIGNYVYRTTNGGRTWQAQSNISNGQAIYFSDPDHGWAVGGDGKILNTRNGGRSWQLQDSQITNRTIQDVFFLDSLRGWVAAYNPATGGGVSRTGDGGRTWWGTIGGTFPFNSIQFFTPMLGYGGGTGLSKTTNGGENWSSPVIPSPSVPSHFFFLNQDTGWATAQYQVLRTTNAGATWTAHPIGISMGEIRGKLHFTDRRHGWAAGDAGIIRTTDGGTTWSREFVASALTSVHFSRPGHGWAVGLGGQVYKYTDTSMITAQKNMVRRKIQIATLHPNPGNGQAKLHLSKPAQVEVFDLLSNRVASLGVKAAGTHSLLLAPFGKGIYLVCIQSTVGTQTLKAIVE